MHLEKLIAEMTAITDADRCITHPDKSKPFLKIGEAI